MSEYCYVSRDSHALNVEVRPATVGLRKFHGCVQWGSAWNKNDATLGLVRSRKATAENLWPHECRLRFGFYPGKGTAWFVDGKKRTKVDIDFSD